MCSRPHPRQTFPAAPPGAGGPRRPLGPCLILKGRGPACGVAPACLLTDNPHLVMPLSALPNVRAWAIA